MPPPPALRLGCATHINKAYLAHETGGKECVLTGCIARRSTVMYMHDYLYLHFLNAYVEHFYETSNLFEIHVFFL